MGGSVYTVLEYDGVGLVVEGSVYSVGLALSDGRRHGVRAVWLKSDAGLLGVDPSVPWEAKELHHA